MQDQSERQFNRWMLTALFAGFALLVIAFGLIVSGLRSSQQSSDLVRHTYEVKDTLADLTVALERSEAARRGYLIAPSLYREAIYRAWSPRILPATARLRALTADNPRQVDRLRALRPLVTRQLNLLNRSMTLATGGKLAQARAEFDTGGSLNTLQLIRDLTQQIGATEERLLNRRLASASSRLGLLRWFLVLTGLMLAAVAAFTFWLVRRFTRDLLESRENLYRLNAGLEDAVAERTADLQRANDEIQRFAYIVSHDLRSPLVNVMGFTAELERADNVLTEFVGKVDKDHADLVSDDVRNAANEDLPEAIGFIRSATQKMDRLINAILALSRQGRRVLNPQHLDMTALVRDIAGNLAILAGERGAEIEVMAPLPDLNQDRLAVEQIFTNLVENATKYLKPGQAGRIVVRGSRRGGRATFEIEDNGRGIAPEDQERIFELFRRAGQQDQKGEGIGLANVRALAYRLGGTVAVRSVLGEGSTFIVDLPMKFSSEGNSA